MSITIIDYGMGNLKSVQKAFVALGYEAEITQDPEKILKAEKVVLPGVGAFRDAIAMLNQTGLGEATKEVAKKGTPLLGICLGMQLLFDKSYEYGEYEGLHLLPGEIVRFKEDNIKQANGECLKVPHMGWNTIANTNSDLFKDFTKDEFVYFVHSFYVPVNNCTAAVTDYIHPFSAALHKDNFYATQFHPEKSGSVGERILKNFLEL